MPVIYKADASQAASKEFSRFNAPDVGGGAPTNTTQIGNTTRIIQETSQLGTYFPKHPKCYKLQLNGTESGLWTQTTFGVRTELGQHNGGGTPIAGHLELQGQERWHAVWIWVDSGFADN